MRKGTGFLVPSIETARACWHRKSMRRRLRRSASAPREENKEFFGQKLVWLVT